MKEEIKKELQQLGSSLDQKVTPQRPTLPEDYFTQMQASVLNEAGLPAQAATSPNSLWNTIQQWFTPRAALATAGLAAIVFFIFIIKPSPTQDSLTFASLDEASTNLYIDNYIDEFDVELLSELLADETDLNIDLDDNEEDLILDEALEDLDISEIEELL